MRGFGAVTALALSALVVAAPIGAAGASRTVPKVSAYGDSVMLGAKPYILRIFGGHVDAQESRQAGPTLSAVRRAAKHHRLHPLVVIHVGTNGTVDGKYLKGTLRIAFADRQVRRVEVLTDHVPRPWQGPNNRLIRKVVAGFRRAILVDWHRAADRHPGWLYSDGVHLTPDGQRGYARLLRSRYLAAA